MPKHLLPLIISLTLTACTLQVGVEGSPYITIPSDAAQPATISALSPAPTADTLLPAVTQINSPAAIIAHTASPIPATSTHTPTPTPVPGTPPPTPEPLPTETPTLTPVPTVIPATPAVISGALPEGWFAYRRTVQLIPNDPSPSAYGCQVWVQRTDGSGERNLTPPDANCATIPAFSPDGQRVAFMVGYIRNLSAGLGGDLWVANVDGTEQIRLTGGSTTPTWIVWSKDGTQIANYFYGSSRWHVYDVTQGSATGEAVESLDPAVWRVPNLSPDGRYRATYCEMSVDTYHRLCVTELASDPRPLGQLHLDQSIVWTPDGQWIVYRDSDGTYAVRPDGSGRERITGEIGDWWFNPAP